jgi:hypothetical protein
MQTTKYLSEIKARGWLRSTEPLFFFALDLHLPFLLKIKPAKNPAELKLEIIQLNYKDRNQLLSALHRKGTLYKNIKNQMNRKNETKN